MMATRAQVIALTDLIRDHEGLDALRDTTSGNVYIETAYVVQILDALCACLRGERSYKDVSMQIMEMAP
jgi:hypothetical protein